MNAGAQMWKELCGVQTLPRKVSSTTLSLLQGPLALPRLPAPQPTFQQPFVWCEVLDISFPRASLWQHYRVVKLWKQSPLSDFSQLQPHNYVTRTQGLRERKGLVLFETSLHHLSQMSLAYKFQQPNFWSSHPIINYCRLRIPLPYYECEAGTLL